jgi:hypothetical protein
MILKSLVLRISRESKRTPVILDDQYACALEALVAAVAAEVKDSHIPSLGDAAHADLSCYVPLLRTCFISPPLPPDLAPLSLS